MRAALYADLSAWTAGGSRSHLETLERPGAVQPVPTLDGLEEPIVECDHPDCDQAAQWYLCRAKCCPAVVDLLFCTGHKNEVLKFRFPQKCLRCRQWFLWLSALFPRIEAL